MSEEFYSMKEKKKVTLQAKDISVKKLKVRGQIRYQLKGTYKGSNVSKFANEATAKKYL